MIFTDIEITNLNLNSNCINDIYILLAKYLCGIHFLRGMSESESDLLNRYIVEIERRGKGVNFAQFNELLLILDLDQVSEEFFEFFFLNNRITDDGYISLDEIKIGIEYFRGLSMLSFGNLENVFTQCRIMNRAELENAFSPFNKKPEINKDYYSRRPEIILDTQKIKRDETWMLGYISGAKLLKDINEAEKQLTTKKDQETILSTKEYLQNLQEMKTKNDKNEIIALNNTDIYLTWDYLDVYFATSMRERWEYEEIYDFIEELFATNKQSKLENNNNLDELKLRYFNPTQSICNNPRNKGLIEGLMLKRCRVTIYMGQESDTLGKDSELAATLAQKNPVIAYYPLINPDEYWEVIKDRSLYYFIKRIYVLNAEGVFDQINNDESFKKIAYYYNEILSDFVDRINLFYKNDCPYSLFQKKENIFKQQKYFIKKPENDNGKGLEFNSENGIIEYTFYDICKLLAFAEHCVFEKRADVMKSKHPLAMQIDLENGVSNGVLIVRNSNQCRELLYNLLTNSCEFTIIHILLYSISKKEWSTFSDYLKVSSQQAILDCISYDTEDFFIYQKRFLSGKEIEILKDMKDNDKIPFSIRRQLNEIENIGLTALKEKISGCFFRIVTDDRKITNSFWNLFYKNKED